MLLSVLVAVNPLASAATAPVGSTGLGIDPRKNLIVSPGQTVKDTLIVNNLSQKYSLGITLHIIDFTYYNNTGTPKLFLSPNAPQTSWSLKPFLHLPDSFVVTPGGQQQINYSVTVPKNQGAGSYYSAIEYSAAGSGGGNVALNASGVTLMFVTVPGTFKENLTLNKLGAYTNANVAYEGKYTYINTSLPTQIGYTLTNRGNVAESPSGSATIKYMFGGKPITIGSLNPNQELALLGQTRLFTSCMKSVPQTGTFNGAQVTTTACGTQSLKPGYYSVSANLFYGQNGNQTREISGMAGFWYLPWWFIGVVLFVILLIAYAVWRIKRKLSGKSSGNFKLRRRR